MPGTQTKALVVDDNRALASVICFNLEQIGLAVTCAYDGAEAWQCLQNDTFDLVVTDQQMPQMSGLELCEHMQEVEHLRDVPTIMLTAKGLEMDLSKLHEKLNIAAILSKPFSPAELIGLVRSLLRMPEHALQ